MIAEELPWACPQEVAQVLCAHERYWVFLHSGQQLPHTGERSILALYPQETLTGERFSPLAQKLGSRQSIFENAWFGYFGYEMLHDVETLPRETRSYITLPDMWFTRFGLILDFNHAYKKITCWHLPDITVPSIFSQPSDDFMIAKVTSLTSPMSREMYFQIVCDTKDAIDRGEFYQANITRKFIGCFESEPKPMALFSRLHNASPAAYSAVMRMDDAFIISSSPERFLHMDAQGRMMSRLIKGTAPRYADPLMDAESRNHLHNSEKDRAENLMIVDLMRNDFSRSAVPASVKAEELFEVTSYATLYHMESTVTAQKSPDISALEAVRNCFPPGSMTGAPKIRAMEWCLEQEKIRRGVYSGALGWFGGDGSCDFSVVIRTLIVQGRQFEFQVGGAITADSDPEKEWQESLTKARGIMSALGLNIKMLEAI